MYTLALRDGVATSNPVRTVAKFPERGGRVVYLDHEQEQAVLEALPPLYRTYFLIAVHTGLRWSEQMRIRWQGIDLLRGFITIPTSKNHTGRRVPINSIVRPAFVELGSRRRRPDDPEEHVFDPRPGQPAFFTKPVAVAKLKESGKDTTMMTGFTWHGGCHTFASRLVIRRGPPDGEGAGRVEDVGDGAAVRATGAEPPAGRGGAAGPCQDPGVLPRG
jgi:integrase